MWLLFVCVAILYTYHSLRSVNEYGGVPFLYGECLRAHHLSFFVRALSFFLFVASLLFLILTAASAIFEKSPLSFLFQKGKISFSEKKTTLVSFVIDRSGSMSEPMPTDTSQTKMEVVKRALEGFVSRLDSHDNDTLINLMNFSRVALVRAPFSRDRTFLLSAISSMVPEKDPLLNGTALGYAVFKNVRLILACKAFSSEEKGAFLQQSMIVITDGLEEPHPDDRTHPFRSMRLKQALENAAECGVKIFYINIDKNTYRMMGNEERDALIAAVKLTGGSYYEVSLGDSLDQILGRVVEKEGEHVVAPSSNQPIVVFFLLSWAMVALSFSRALETCFLRVKR